MLKEKYRKYRMWFVSPLIITFLILLIYYCKGIFPFGTKSIICADLGQGYLPWYYNIHNIFNSGKSLFFSFDLGLGTNFYLGLISNAFFCPLTWLFAFIKRDSIINFINIFLIIKMSCISIAGFIFYRKIFTKVKDYWCIIFSLLYGMSGYILTNYHNIIWLDSLILFPFLVMSILRLFKTGKVLTYILMLTLTILFNYYIAYMIILAIVFCGSIYIVFFVEPEDRKKIMMKSILGTLAALGLSMVFLLPILMWVPKTYRYLYLKEEYSDYGLGTKLSTYFCYALPIIFYSLNLIKLYNSDRKKFKFWLILLFITSSSLVIEPINRMWHGGSYVRFPYRHGFISLFIISCGAISYLNDFKEKGIIYLKRIKSIKLLSFFIFILALIGYMFYSFTPSILNYELPMGLNSLRIFGYISLVAILFLILNAYVLLFFKDKIKYILLGILVITQLFIFGYWYIGMDYGIKKIPLGHTDILPKNILEAKKYFNIEQSNYIDRYKDTTASFDENYGYVMEVPTISNWTHMITYEQLRAHFNLGYSYRYTRLQDLGGTLFSDSFYHIKYIFSYDNLDKSVYTLIKSMSDLKLYQTATLPFGIINDNKKINITKKMDTFDYQNELYHRLFNENDDIVTRVNNTFELSKEGNCCELNMDLEENSNLYLTSLNITLNKAIDRIVVNGKEICIPTIDNQKNTKYPIYDYIGIVNLGNYIGSVNIKVYGVSLKYLNDIKIGYININKYNEFIKEHSNYNTSTSINGSKLTMCVNSDSDNKYLLIPICYYKGTEAYVNGKKVEITAYLDNYINIPLERGNNNVVIKFYPDNMKLGLIITILTLMGLTATIVFNKKYKLEDNKKIQKVFSGLFIFFSVTGFILVYVISLFIFKNS